MRISIVLNVENQYKFFLGCDIMNIVKCEKCNSVPKFCKCKEPKIIRKQI